MANPTMTLISSNTVGSGTTTSVTFSSIPATYTDLFVQVSARDSSGGTLNNNLQITFNGSSTSMTDLELYGTGTAAGSASLTAMRVGYVPSSTATANVFGSGEIYIPNYASANNKSASAFGVAEGNTAGMYMALEANLWSNTAAITSITFTLGNTYNFAQYSTFYLYGIKNN